MSSFLLFSICATYCTLSAKAVVAELRAMKLKKAVKKVEDGIEDAFIAG